MKPYLQLNPDNTVAIGDYSHEMLKDYAFDPVKDDYIKDWEFSAKDFEIGFTYLNHNQSCYTVLDKGVTYFDEPFIKVQLVTNQPNFDWTVWAVHPEMGKDGSIEWAYSKERDMTIDPENYINLEEQEMSNSMKITANMTALTQGTEKDPSFRGFASITVNDSYAIGNIAVRENTNTDYPNAYYAEMPSVKIGDNYVPVVYVSPEARDVINKAISEAMQAAMVQGKGEQTYPIVTAELEAKEGAKSLAVSVKDNPYDDSTVKAYAKVNIESHIEINRVKICTGKNGDFISMPSRKGTDRQC
jgi:DNA-binding cell septation regulator SpoVG